MSLRARLTLLIAGSVIVAVFVGALGAQLSTDRELRGEIDQLLRDQSREVSEIADRIPGGFDRIPPDFLDRAPRGGRRGSFGSDSVVQLLNSSGEVIGNFGDLDLFIPIGGKDLDLAADNGRDHYRNETVNGVRYRVLTVSVQEGGAIQVARSLGEVEEVLGGVRQRLLVVGVIVAAAAAVVVWFLTRRMTRPVQELAAAAETVAATQDLSVPITVRGTDEVGRLAVSFNTMLEALRQSRAQQHDLVMDASHELRTPLTSLRTNIELLQRGDALSSDQRGELVDASVAELTELTDLVAELVELATDSRETEAVSTIDLVATAQAVVERVQRRTGRSIDVEGAASAVIAGRATMIDRAITNLVENAVKFSPDDAAVQVLVGERSVQVRDRGPGIPTDDQQKIFSRFYRSTATRSAPGSGLGLAIVKQIVDAHGGDVFVADNPGGGAIVGFELSAG